MFIFQGRARVQEARSGKKGGWQLSKRHIALLTDCYSQRCLRGVSGDTLQTSLFTNIKWGETGREFQFSTSSYHGLFSTRERRSTGIPFLMLSKARKVRHGWLSRDGQVMSWDTKMSKPGE